MVLTDRNRSASRRDARRNVLLALSLGAAAYLVAIATPAFAGWAYSSTAQFSAGGYTYDDGASIYANPGDNTEAWTTVWTASGVYVPSGYMGAMAVIYNADGSVCRASAYAYSSGSQNQFAQESTPGCGPSKCYNSRGVAKGWVPSTQTYSANYTFRSPNQCS